MTWLLKSAALLLHAVRCLSHGAALIPSTRGLLQLMKDMELTTIKAAVTGDYGTAQQAFTLNPLVPSGKIAGTILDELLVAHKKHLPQFQEKIAQLEAEGR